MSPDPVRSWMLRIPVLAGAGLTVLSVFSYTSADAAAWESGRSVQNLCGPLGHLTAAAWLFLSGVTAYPLTLALLALGLRNLVAHPLRIGIGRVLGVLLAALSTMALVELAHAGGPKTVGRGGGWLGAHLLEALAGILSQTGAAVVLVALFLVSWLVAVGFQAARLYDAFVSRSVQGSKTGASAAWDWGTRASRLLRDRWSDWSLTQTDDTTDDPSDDTRAGTTPPHPVPTPPRVHGRPAEPSPAPPVAAAPAPEQPPLPAAASTGRAHSEPQLLPPQGRGSPPPIRPESTPRPAPWNAAPDGAEALTEAPAPASWERPSAAVPILAEVGGRRVVSPAAEALTEPAPPRIVWKPDPTPQRIGPDPAAEPIRAPAPMPFGLAESLAPAPAPRTDAPGPERPAADRTPEPPHVAAPLPAEGPHRTPSPGSPPPIEESSDEDETPPSTGNRGPAAPRPPPIVTARGLDDGGGFSASAPRSPFRMAPGVTSWRIPRLDDVLQPTPASQRVIDRPQLAATASRLVQKLENLGVQGEVTEIRPGPVVTVYEFRPAPGIKLARIAALGQDLAMAMEALSVRIVAPIPGKGVVGFEVPNRRRETVYLREVVEQGGFGPGTSRLTMGVGKDIEGTPYLLDLARMPHLLIAGTTGSGKSVGVNAMLVSMLLRATPDELRFVMVDPKMLELSVYEGIPHLLLPVVTDARKAAMALRWAVEEMERRYQQMADAGVRNIGQFNDWVAAGAEGRDPDSPPPQKLPWIVIVIDELADLMMVAAKDVEVYIARLAQMARAAGLHLMVATQRPSTDVLTGVIKANFPSRISFQVASRHDSATIINTPGAEFLLGMGDMLVLPPGTSLLTRVHGAYVSEAEIHRLTAFWKAQGTPVYDPEILRARDESEGGEEDPQLIDPLYDQAVAVISEMKQVSTSMLQRKMRIGYNRAARIIERLEREGLVGPADGARPREVLVRPIGEMPGA